jgi:hypothetical protein
MGWKLKMIEGIKLCPNEERELPIVLQPETRAAIHGVVKFPDGKPVKNAVVKLFRKKSGCEPCELIPVTFSFTDECGQFLFGVPSGVEFVVKVFFFKSEHEHGNKFDEEVVM